MSASEDRQRAGTWSGTPNPTVKITSRSDIDRCPTTRMDPKHFRPDGTCMCVPPRDERLEPHIVRGEN